MFKLLRTKLHAGTICGIPLAMGLGLAQNSSAMEVLTVHELVGHCEHLESEPDGVDGQYCIRYIQGFIDGAIETDERVVQSLESASGKSETLTERAMRTRLPRSGSSNRPGSLAGFCLGDPLALRAVVDNVVKDLVALDIGDAADSPARIAVDDSLRQHYPCTK